VSNRPEIDRLLTEFSNACREQGAEQAKLHCDLHYLTRLIERAAKIRNELHAQIDQIALDAVQSGVEKRSFPLDEALNMGDGVYRP